jgi:hypothetical protein
MPPVLRNSTDRRVVRMRELEEELAALQMSLEEEPPEPEPEPEPEPDKIVGYYTMERKKDEDGTPKKVPLHKGPKDGLYYFNEAGNKVYGTPSSKNVEMIENDEE